jgi:IclR family acetate operon transcriptional repressor
MHTHNQVERRSKSRDSYKIAPAPTEKNQLVLKAFAMLSCFQRSDEWVTGGELSRRANLPQASGYRLIQTLEKIGAIIRGPRGRYRPGMLLVSLSQNVAIGELLRNSSHNIAADLARRFNLTVHLGMLEEGMVTYVNKVTTPSSFPVKTRVGAQLEAYCSALGKVLLSALSRERLDSIILDGDLVSLTENTITSPHLLRAELEKVRRQRYAVDNRESEADMVCVAVPIRDIEGRIIAAMSATDHARKMTHQQQLLIRDALWAAVAELERKVFPARLNSAA